MKGRKYSFPTTKSQTPFFETPRTSASEVLFPGFRDFTVPLLNDLLQFTQLFLREANMAGQSHHRFHPKLGFSIGTGGVDMHSGLFPREEKESVVFHSEDSRTHAAILTPQPNAMQPPIRRYSKSLQNGGGTPAIFHDVQYPFLTKKIGDLVLGFGAIIPSTSPSC